jgi:hypothetical protein
MCARLLTRRNPVKLSIVSQPTRDPNDVRYWPQSEGGQGFNRTGDPRYQYSALTAGDTQGARTRRTMSLPSIVAAADADTVKGKARAATLLVIERITEMVASDNPFTLNELSGSLSALGRVSGIADEQRDSTVSIHIVRDEAPQLPTVTATYLGDGTHDAEQHEAAQRVSDEGGGRG